LLEELIKGIINASSFVAHCHPNCRLIVLASLRYFFHPLYTTFFTLYTLPFSLSIHYLFHSFDKLLGFFSLQTANYSLPSCHRTLSSWGIAAVHNLWDSAFYFGRVIELGELRELRELRELGELDELDGDVLELVGALYPKEQEAPLGLSRPLMAQEAVLLDL
jgi:hypothetical protein